MPKPVIITCAPTGGIHAHTVSPHLPVTPEETAQAGAAIIHLHARKLAILGGNARVGMEDSLFIGPGELTPSNAARVTKIRGIFESLGHTVATPQQARDRLGLKGGDRVTL